VVRNIPQLADLLADDGKKSEALEAPPSRQLGAAPERRCGQRP